MLWGLLFPGLGVLAVWWSPCSSVLAISLLLEVNYPGDLVSNCVSVLPTLFNVAFSLQLAVKDLFCIFRSFLELIAVDILVVLVCPLEEVSSGSSHLTIFHKQQNQFIRPLLLLLGTLDDTPTPHGLLSYRYTIFMKLLLVIYGPWSFTWPLSLLTETQKRETCSNVNICKDLNAVFYNILHWTKYIIH